MLAVIVTFKLAILSNMQDDRYELFYSNYYYYMRYENTLNCHYSEFESISGVAQAVLGPTVPLIYMD